MLDSPHRPPDKGQHRPISTTNRQEEQEEEQGRERIDWLRLPIAPAWRKSSAAHSPFLLTMGLAISTNDSIRELEGGFPSQIIRVSILPSIHSVSFTIHSLPGL